MGFVNLKCPDCGASIVLDESREFGFCQYCGAKVVQDKIVIEHRGAVAFDRTGEVRNLLIRARRFYEQGRYDEAEAYYDRLLDIDATNVAANNEIQKIYQIIKEPNVTLYVTKGRFYGKDVQVNVKIDGKKVNRVSPAYPSVYTLSAGNHTIDVSIVHALGSKKTIPLTIRDRYTKLRFNIHCKFGNVIEIRNG